MTGRMPRGRRAALTTAALAALLLAVPVAQASTDTTPPTGSWISVKPGPVPLSTTTDTVNLSWTASDSGSGLASVTITELYGRQVVLGDCANVAWSTAWTFSHASPWSISRFNKGDCYRWVLNLRDQAGNTAQVVSNVVVVTSAPYLSAERLYLSYINCMRTGGLISPTGVCYGYGSGKYSKYVRPLALSFAISNLDSRPYASLEAAKNVCSHFADGTPAQRLARSGFTNSWSGENIACNDYTTAAGLALWAARAFQAERTTNGPHWANIKNAEYTSTGVGIADYGGRWRLVEDFYKAW